MGCFMVKEHTLLLMEQGILGNTRMITDGTEQYTTKMESSMEGMWTDCMKVTNLLKPDFIYSC